MILIAESPSRRTEYRRYLGNAGLCIYRLAARCHRDNGPRSQHDQLNHRLHSRLDRHLNVARGGRILDLVFKMDRTKGLDQLAHRRATSIYRLLHNVYYGKY